MRATIQKIRSNAKAFLAVLAAVGLVFGAGAPAVMAAPTEASLRLGDSRPGETSTYTFDASTLDSTTTIRCVELDLGASSDGSGAITGLDTSSSTLSSGTMFDTFGNWAVSNAESANHVLRATYTTGETLNASGNVVWGAVDNGTTADTGYFGVFTTYSDDTCSTEVESVTVQFIYTEGTQVSLTVDPSFTFTVNGVTGDGVETVNGATITNGLETTGTTVPFGLVTTSGTSIAAQDLSISTNAQNGYDVFARYTGALSNGSETLADISHAYASPGSFPASTEAFGFTTDDLFGSDTWAALETTDREVASNASAFSGTETTRVGYQVGIDTDTAPGTYTTTIIYTSVPKY